jgi:hypothetical protein
MHTLLHPDDAQKIDSMVERAESLFGQDFVRQNGVREYLTDLLSRPASSGVQVQSIQTFDRRLSDDELRLATEPKPCTVHIPVVETEDAEGWPDYVPASEVYQAPILDAIRTAD